MVSAGATGRTPTSWATPPNTWGVDLTLVERRLRRVTAPGQTDGCGVGNSLSSLGVIGSTSPLLVRRSYINASKSNGCSTPPPDRLLRLSRPALLPITSVVCVDTTEHVVALTYDDGPDPDHTPGILDALAASGCHATFFVLVEAAEQHRELLGRIVAEGHEVALHGVDHTRLAALPAGSATAVIAEGKRRLEEVLGRPIEVFRPTYGALRVRQLLASRRLGLDVVIWTAMAREWEGAPADVVAGNVLETLHPGGIVLLHDSSGDDSGGDDALDRAEATRLILAGMAERDYRGLTVTELIRRHRQVRSVWVKRR